MSETITVDRDEWINLKERTRRLALDKAYLQLITNLMNKLSLVPGLENVIDNMLKIVLDSFGGTNVIIYYIIDEIKCYADIYGKRQKIDSIQDDLVKKVFETREFIKIDLDFSESKMLIPVFTKASTWIFPLIVGSDLIGVLKMEGMHIDTEEFILYLPTFFNYAALILKNEIMGYSRLNKAYDQLRKANIELVNEIAERNQAEQKLRAAKEELEIRVSQRTEELQNINRQLQLELAERKHAEKALQEKTEELDRYFTNALDLLCIADTDGYFRRLNPEWESTLGYSVSELEGRRFLDFVHPEDLEATLLTVSRLTGQNEVLNFTNRYRCRNGAYRWLEWRSFPSGKRIYAVAHDITERKRAEEALHRLNRELRAISNCNQVLMRAEDEQTLLNDICRIVCDEAGYRMAWVGYAENDDAKTIRPVAWAGVEDGYLANARHHLGRHGTGRGPSGTAIRSGETDCIQDFATDPKAAPWRDSALQRGYRSSIALPLKDESANTFGVLNIYSTEPNAFTRGRNTAPGGTVRRSGVRHHGPARPHRT